MKIITKYSVGDAVFIGKDVFGIHRIKIDVGLRLMEFNPKAFDVMYSVQRPDGTDYCMVAQGLITKKATEKDWIKAGGQLKEKK